MTKLLTDTMLGRLTTYLRMCGYDTVYTLDVGLEADDEIRRFASAEDRVLVTRDEQLAARTTGAILLESLDVTEMLSTIREAGFDVSLPETPRRCSICNGTVEAVSTEDSTPEYAPDPHSVDIWRCTQCGQHFWKGSHWDDVTETLSSLP